MKPNSKAATKRAIPRITAELNSNVIMVGLEKITLPEGWRIAIRKFGYVEVIGHGHTIRIAIGDLLAGHTPLEVQAEIHRLLHNPVRETRITLCPL